MKFVKSKLDPITIKIGGIEYPARLPFSALAEIEELTGESFFNAFNGFNAEILLKLTYAALKGGGVELEYQDLEDCEFSMEDLNEMTNKIMKLIQLTMELEPNSNVVSINKNKTKNRKKKNRSR